MRQALLLLTPLLALAQETSRNSLTIPPAADVAEKMQQIDALIRSGKYRAAATLINALLQKPTALLKKDKTYHPILQHLIKRAENWPDEMKLLLATSQDTKAREHLTKGEHNIHTLITLARRFPFSQTAIEALIRAADIAFESGKLPLALALYQEGIRSFKNSQILKKKIEALKKVMPSTAESGPTSSPKAESLSAIKRFWLPRAIPTSPSFFPSSATVYHYAATFAFGRFYIATNNTVVEVDPQTGKTRFFRPPSGICGFIDYDYCSTCTVTERFVFSPFVVSLTAERFNLGIPAKACIPLRSVAVFDRKRGKFLFWLHKFKGFKERFGKVKWSIQQPPAVVGNLAYCEIKTYTNTVNSYIAVFDLASQKLLQAQIFCSNGVELTLWEFMAREPPATPPIVEGRRLFVVSNLGAVACYDIYTNSILWVSEYEQFRIVSRFPYANYPSYRSFCWAFSRPAVTENAIIATPIDSPFVFAFDKRTGRVLWRFRYDTLGADLRVLLGVSDGRVLVAGKHVVCLDARSGKLLWSRAGNRALGIPARTEGGFLVTGLEGALEVDGSGVRRVRSVRRRGNLCGGNGFLLVVGEHEAVLMGPGR